MMLAKNKNEFDLEKKHKFPLWIVLVLLLSLYLVFVLGLFTFRSILSNSSWKLSKDTITGQSVESYLSDVVKKGKGNSLSLVLTDSQINELLANSLSGIALSDASAKIKSEGIIISGKYPAIIPINVDILLVPKVDKGDISFDIKEIKSFGVTVPKTIKDTVLASITPSLNNLKIAEGKVYVETVELATGQAKITGRAL